MKTAEVNKERILNSALSLYSKYGLKSVTMDDLCRELGISKKTLYQIVVDKNDLISLVLDYERELQQSSMEKLFRSGLNAIDELIHVNRHIHTNQVIHSPTFYFDLKKYYPFFYNDWLEFKRKRMYDMIIRNLEKGISEGLYRKDMDVRVIAKLHMARTEMLHVSDIVNDEEFSTTSFVDEVFQYHIHGICNEAGLAYFKNKMKEFNNSNYTI
jgi:AcrR family transcriptional regulator